MYFQDQLPIVLNDITLPFGITQHTLNCFLVLYVANTFGMQVPSSSFKFLQVPSSSFKFLQVPSSSFKFLQVPSSSFKFLQVPSSSFKFLQVPSSSFKFLQVPSSSFKFLQVPSSSFKFLQVPSSSFKLLQVPSACGWSKLRSHEYTLKLACWGSTSLPSLYSLVPRPHYLPSSC